MTRFIWTTGRLPGAALLLALAAGCGPSRSAAPASGPADVNIGYTTEAQATSTASASTLTEEQLANAHPTSMADLLARVPGLTVNRSGGGEFMVRVRGITSLTGHSEPLYVVDGVILSGSVGSALDAIVPSSVRRIDVLKDSGSLAIYGSRGANGVILITTSRAR